MHRRTTFFLSVALGLLLLALCYAAPSAPAALAVEDAPALTATPSPILATETPTLTETSTPIEPPTATPTPAATSTPTATPPLNRPLTCADVPAEVHCVLLDPMVRLSWRLGTRWSIANPGDKEVPIFITYQDITGTVVFTAQIGIVGHGSNNFYLSDEQRADIPVGFDGSALLTSTGEFTASLYMQTVACQPGELNCSVLADIAVTGDLTTTEQPRRFYSVSNPLPLVNEISSGFYVYGLRICQFTDRFAPGETKVYDMVYEIRHRGWPYCAVPGESLALWARRAGMPGGDAAAWAPASPQASLLSTQATQATTSGGAVKLTSTYSYVAGRGLLEWGGSVVWLPTVRR